MSPVNPFEDPSIGTLDGYQIARQGLNLPTLPEAKARLAAVNAELSEMERHCAPILRSMAAGEADIVNPSPDNGNDLGTSGAAFIEERFSDGSRARRLRPEAGRVLDRLHRLRHEHEKQVALVEQVEEATSEAIALHPEADFILAPGRRLSLMKGPVPLSEAKARCRFQSEEAFEAAIRAGILVPIQFKPTRGRKAKP
jgi:hypothetical protein